MGFSLECEAFEIIPFLFQFNYLRNVCTLVILNYLFRLTPETEELSNLHVNIDIYNAFVWWCLLPTFLLECPVRWVSQSEVDVALEIPVRLVLVEQPRQELWREGDQERLEVTMETTSTPRTAGKYHGNWLLTCWRRQKEAIESIIAQSLELGYLSNCHC